MRPWSLPALVVLALAGACGDELPARDVVARVSGVEIPLSAFEDYLEEASIQLDGDLDSRVLTQLFDEFLDESRIRLTALDEGLIDEEGSRRDALAALLDARMEGEITDERVLLYYRTHSQRFERPERVRLSQILVADRETVDQALEEIRRGVAFDEVARRVSIDPAAAVGGDQGFLSRDDLPPAFMETIFGLEEGEVSSIVAADYGFHLFQVTERRPAEAVPLDQAVLEIRDRLRRVDSETVRATLADEARARYNTRVYASNLPFDYQGSHSAGKTAP